MEKRQQEILAYLAANHFASMAELAGVIFASQATARRDVEKLQAQGFVKTVYGGVVLAEYHQEPVPIYLRDGENAAGKEQIAAAAARLIPQNATVIFDSSSTVRRICKHIKDRAGLTVITNNLRVCRELKDTAVKVVCTGGTLVPKRECFVGHFAEEFVKKVKADQLFFSSQGLSLNGDITDSSEEEIALRRAMFQSAKQKIFLCDSSKVGRDYPFTLCNTNSIDQMIQNK